MLMIVVVVVGGSGGVAQPIVKFNCSLYCRMFCEKKISQFTKWQKAENCQIVHFKFFFHIFA